MPTNLFRLGSHHAASYHCRHASPPAHGCHLGVPPTNSPHPAHIPAALIDESVIASGTGVSGCCGAGRSEAAGAAELGLPSVSRIGASPLWRAGLAIVFILGLA